MQLFARSPRSLPMSESPPSESARLRGISDVHLHLGLPSKRSDAVGACLRKALEDDVDEDVPEEFDKLFRMLG